MFIKSLGLVLLDVPAAPGATTAVLIVAKYRNAVSKSTPVWWSFPSPDSCKAPSFVWHSWAALDHRGMHTQPADAPLLCQELTRVVTHSLPFYATSCHSSTRCNYELNSDRIRDICRSSIVRSTLACCGIVEITIAWRWAKAVLCICACFTR